MTGMRQLHVVAAKPFDEDLAARHFSNASTARELAAVAASLRGRVPSLDALRAALWRFSETMESSQDAAGLRELLMRTDAH